MSDFLLIVFLYFLKKLTTHTSAKAKATFEGNNSENEYMAVSNLATRLYTYNHAKVRFSDIISCEFPAIAKNTQ